jgi:decaprenylphospho-beta-D-ribofuranose 2-oxidase
MAAATEASSAAFWPGGPIAERRFMTFDGSHGGRSRLRRPDRYAAFHRGGGEEVVIARGAGLSYVAASFGAGTTAIDLTAFDRILGFDAGSLLVEVEAGATLGALYDFLLPRGFYLPVQPGYRAITVGGCIGADVHGKNPARDGTFLSQVESLRLFHPDHGTIDLSATAEPELFRATCGGLGLTGIILTARLRVQALPSRLAEITLVPVATALEGAAVLRSAAAEAGGAHSWHDFSWFDRRFGRGHVRIFRFSDHPPEQNDAAKPLRSTLSPERRAALPFCLLNSWTIRAINFAYASSRPADATTRLADLSEVLFPVHGNELYFSLFGRAGFHESQVIIPHDAVADYLELIRAEARRRRVAVALGSAKLFAGKPDLLRFDGDGIGLAINVPRSARALPFLAELDRFVAAAGGRPYLIKDSRLSRDVFEATYPESGQFRSILKGWDPKRRFRSELARRLGL